MAYIDTVLAKNPIQYCTLTGSSGATNLVGNTANDMTSFTAGSSMPIVAGSKIGSVTSDTVPNPMGALVSSGQSRSYTIELWGKIKGNTFSGDKSTAVNIISNQNGTCKIYAENSFIKFLITDTAGNTYIAWTNFNDWNEPFHLVAQYGLDGFSVTVNADAGESIQIPNTSTIASTPVDTLTIDSTYVFLSHYAVYSRKLTIDEINSNYAAGNKSIDKQVVTRSVGGNFYPLSKQQSTYPYIKTIGSQDFISGNLRNLILDKGGVKCIEYPSFKTRDNTGTEVSTSYGTGLTIGSTQHAYIPASQTVNSTTGYIGVQVPVTSATAQKILTIYSKSYRKSWCWYLDSSLVLHLIVNTYDTDESVLSSTTYNYATAATARTSQKIWFIFDSSGIKVSTWGTGLVPTTNTYNLCSGSDTIAEQITVDPTTEILLNTDESYSGGGSAYISKAWFGNTTPTSWAGVFADLELPENTTCWYDFTSGSNRVNAKTQGEWTYTFNLGMDDAYYGSFIDYDLSDDGLSSVWMSYNDGAYSKCSQKSNFPVIPFSGTFADPITNPSGPFKIKAYLKTDDIEVNRPEINYINMYLYADNTLQTTGSIGPAIVSGSSVIMKPVYKDPLQSGKKLNCTFNASTGNIQLPAVTDGGHQTIEFTFSTEGTLAASSVLASSRNTLNTLTNQLLINASRLVTVSGPDWPNTTVYLNGVAVGVGGQTALTDSINHVLIIGDRTTDKALYINSNYDGTLYVSGTSKYSSYGYVNSWDYALSTTNVAPDIISSSLGLINQTLTASDNTMAIVENNSIRISVLPW